VSVPAFEIVTDLTPEESLRAAGVDPRRPETVPFCGDDSTAGSETELQVAVVGRRDTVDLPRSIESSSFFENVVRRAEAGDLSKRAVSALEHWLDGAAERSWDNSWVRFPRRLLRHSASSVLSADLLADKRAPRGPRRADAGRLFVFEDGEEHLRVPISYLLKLALADAVDADAPTPALLTRAGAKLMGCLLNDNTSPETVSVHTPRLSPAAGGGRTLARETARRFLLAPAEAVEDIVIALTGRGFP